MNAQMTIPIGESCTGEDIIPVNTFYKYGYSQSIFTSDELVAGEITSISYKYNDNLPATVSSQIYLGEVSRNMFSNSSDFVTPNNLTLVYSGNVEFRNGWVTITFDTPFDYSGESNLVVAYLNNSGAMTDGYRMFNTCPVVGNKTITCYRSNEPISINSPETVNSAMRMVLNSRPSVKFEINPFDASCNPPTEIIIQQITENSVNLEWTAVEGVGEYKATYKKLNDVIWNDTITTNTNSLLISSLDANTNYELKLWSVCESESSVAITTSFTTYPPAEQVSSLPFTCNFDTPEEGNLWTILNGNQTNKWHYGTATNSIFGNTSAVSGAMYVSDNNGVSNNYNTEVTSTVYFSRYIQFGSAPEFKLSFDWNCLGEGNSDYLKVFLIPSTTELSNNIILETGGLTEKLSGINEWRNEEIIIPGDYANGIYNLVFIWRNDFTVGQQPPAAIDNISIEAVNCGRVEDIVVNIEESEEGLNAVVSLFDDNIGEDLTYFVEYKLSNSNDWITVSTNDTTLVLEDLQYLSNYSIRARVLCSETEYSEYSDTIYFSTPCGVISTFPWKENFEQEFVSENNQIGNEYAPKCWAIINGGASYYKWGQSSFASEGDNGIEFYGYANSGVYNDWLITPLINFDGNQILTFKVKKQYASDQPKFKLYYYDATESDITSLSDTSLFEILDTVICNYYSNDFKKMGVDLSDIGNVGRIALVVNEPTTEFYIDEFTIDNKPLCPDVFGLTVNVLSSSSVEVEFDTQNSVGTGWTIAYGQADSTGVFDPELANDTLVVNPTDVLPIVVNNLNTGMYYFAVKSNCGGAYSELERVELPIADTLPYAQSFNDTLIHEWTFMNDSINKWVVGASVDCGTNGGKSLYITNTNGITNSYSLTSPAISYAMTNIVFGDFPAFNLSFNWKGKGENNCDYGKVYLLPLDYELELTSLPDEEYSLTDKLQLQANWQTEEIILGAEYANGVHRLVFAWRNDSSTGQNPPIAIDNIAINALTCAPITSLSLTNVEGSANGIMVAYTDNNTANVTYNIEYKAEGESEWTVITTTEDSYEINNLMYETTYQVRVAVICENGNLTSYVESTITTPCAIISTFPWIEEFAILPNTCWTQMYGDMQDSITYVSDLNTSNANGWKYSDYETVNGVGGGKIHASLSYEYAKYWIVSPSFYLGNGDSIYELSLDVYRRDVNNDILAPEPNGDKFAIIVSTDNGLSWATENALIFGSGDNMNYDYNISMFNLDASNIKFKLVDENNQPLTGTIKIALYGEGMTSKIFVDNMKISEWQDCQTPAMVNVGNITANSAELTFIEYGESTQWEYALMPGNTIDFTTVVPVAMNNPGIYLNNLVDGVTYTVAVRGLCSESQYSDWSEPITFTTPSQPTSLPFETTFNDELDNQKWVMVANTSNAWAIGNATLSTLSEPVENDKAAYLSANGGENYNVVLNSGFNYSYAYLYREFDFENGGTNYTLSFDYKVSGQTYGSSVMAGLYILIKNEEDNIVATYTNTNEALATYAGVNEWTRADLELPEMEGIKKIVFYTWGYASSYTGQAQVPPAIDNIVIQDLVCHPPINLSVSNVTSNSANLTWEGDAENYKINCVVVGEQDTISYTTSSNSYTLSLSSFEDYEVNVQSICEEDLYSLPSTTLTFSTLQDAVTLPYSCNFESAGNNGWLLRNGNCVNQWLVGTPAGRTTSSLFISNDEESASYSPSASSVVIAEKLFQFDNSQYTTISFDLEVGGQISSNIYCDYLKVFLLPANETLEPSSSLNINDDCIYATSDYAQGVILQHLGNNSVCLTEGTQTITIPTPVNEQKKLVFLWRNDYMLGTQPGAIIDNINITTMGNVDEDCLTPDSLVVSDITATTANITWTPQGSESQWQVKINEEIPINVSTPNYTLTNLTPATTYNVSVRANCSVETSEWANATFTTLDTVIVPIVTTLPATAITATTAILNAEITEGTIDIITKGFYYKETANTLWDSIMIEGATETSVIVSNLLPQTTYVYKAFITTENTVIEGEELSFTTDESSLAEINGAIEVNLYPNPTKEKVYLEVKGFEKGVKAVLNDLQGRILKEIEINTERMEIDLNSLSSGVYYLKVFDERSTQAIKIIKE